MSLLDEIKEREAERNKEMPWETKKKVLEEVSECVCKILAHRLEEAYKLNNYRYEICTKTFLRAVPTGEKAICIGNNLTFRFCNLTETPVKTSFGTNNLVRTDCDYSTWIGVKVETKDDVCFVLKCISAYFAQNDLYVLKNGEGEFKAGKLILKTPTMTNHKLDDGLIKYEGSTGNEVGRIVFDLCMKV